MVESSVCIFAAASVVIFLFVYFYFHFIFQAENWTSGGHCIENTFIGIWTIRYNPGDYNAIRFDFTQI